MFNLIPNLSNTVVFDQFYELLRPYIFRLIIVLCGKYKFNNLNAADQMYLDREPGGLILELNFGGSNPSVQNDISLGSCVGIVWGKLSKIC